MGLGRVYWTCSMVFRTAIFSAVAGGVVVVFMGGNRNPRAAGILLVLGSMAAFSFAGMSFLEMTDETRRPRRRALFRWNMGFVVGPLAMGTVALWHAARAFFGTP